MADRADPDDDRDLARRARRGDVVAFESLVRRYQGVAFRAAWLVSRDTQEAEDAVQEGFVKAYYALGRFRAGASFRPWLLRIVTNEARNRRKATTRRDSLAGRAAIQTELAGAGPDSPENSFLTSERRRAVLAAVSELREEDRETVYFRYFLDLSEKETAQALGCARGTVKSRLSRAIAKLRERFDGFEDSDV